VGRLALGVDTEFFEPLELEEHQHHKSQYVLGLSGTGKSVLLGNMAVQYHRMGEGVLVIDTKDGLLCEEIAARYDSEDVIYVAPGLCYWDGQPHYWGLNIFELKHADPDRKDLTFSDMIGTAMALFERMGSLESIMTQVEEHLEMGIRLAVCKKGSTLIDLDKILTDPAWRNAIIANCTVPPKLVEDWRNFDAAYRTANAQAREIKSTLPRVHRLTQPHEIQNMVSQYETTLKIGEWLDQGKMVLCNFGKNVPQLYNVDIGNLVMALAVSEGFRRRRVQEDGKRHWRFIIDEFHQLASRQFAELIDLGRSKRIWPVMAHQNREQLKNFREQNNQLSTSVTGAGVQILLSLGDEDRKHFRDVLSKDRSERIEALEQHQAVVSITGGPADSGFPMTVLLDNWWAERDEARLQRLIDAQKPFTQPKRLVEENNRKRYYPAPENGTKNGNATADTEKDPPEPSGTQSQGGDTPAGADRTRDRDAAAARQGPFRHKRPGRDDV